LEHINRTNPIIVLCNCFCKNSVYKLTVNSKLSLHSPLSQAAMQAPINSFLLFCKDYRTIIATNYPDLSNSDVTSMLGSYWRNLEEGIKNNYVLKARDLNKVFFFNL